MDCRGGGDLEVDCRLACRRLTWGRGAKTFQIIDIFWHCEEKQFKKIFFTICTVVPRATSCKCEETGLAVGTV